ncbi:Uncharacterized protein OBRU01_00250 [Operophtera brumata]|uniref:EGF-like domain-containing protein n=1 Tax=Operophtera brumata TaxID=104452 RepID=A0A0L7LV41_OPEBR|nr:Uncharacterized protein OBRU01_00250 [Operophtera brumata]
MSVGRATPHYLLMALALILSLVGASFCEIASSKEEIKRVSSSEMPALATFNPRVEPSQSTVTSTTATSTTKRSFRTTKAYEGNGSQTTTERHSTKVHASTKGVVKSTRKQKLNSSSSVGVAHSPGRLQERLGAIDCDLAVLPRESRLWRGNETHELNLPVTVIWLGNELMCDFAVRMAAECGSAAPGDECPPVIVSWEGSADIQGGDILIVRIADSLLLDTLVRPDSKNVTPDTNASRANGDRDHRTLLQPAVYQVTRQGHERCDDSDGTLLDITPLDERGAKIFTLYEKDLTEGVNLLIVVSESWKAQCVRLKVTVKSDNCGDSQDCSGKGVCYTNVSMEGYECQCCGGYVGPHCDERDACNPSPCLNNGVCVDLTQAPNSVNYTCVCPYDPCYSAPCLNGGTCMTMAMNGSTTFHCACVDGWAGAQCELSITGGACASNPCVKGICIEQVDDDVDGEEYRCFCQPEDFILEPVMSGEGMESESRGGSSVREVHMPLGLYHDRLHNDKRGSPLSAPFLPPTNSLDTTDMYYTLDFSDSQSSPLIQ